MFISPYHLLILILSAYALIVIAGGMARKQAGRFDVFCGTPALEEHLRLKSRKSLAFFFFWKSLILVGGLIGFVGMFFLWPPAPTIFLLATASKFLNIPLYQVKDDGSAGERLCVGIEYFLDGFLMAIVFFGPVRALFFG